MKNLKINLNMVNTALLVVILVLVITCCVRNSENFQELPPGVSDECKNAIKHVEEACVKMMPNNVTN